ncbi:hypothetical protein FHG87_013189 [Trinorchestia longiramus]|nr:hypothetical protein FHG87_013189 [Trinorchestia longiramus]
MGAAGVCLVSGSAGFCCITQVNTAHSPTLDRLTLTAVPTWPPVSNGLQETTTKGQRKALQDPRSLLLGMCCTSVRCQSSTTLKTTSDMERKCNKYEHERENFMDVVREPYGETQWNARCVEEDSGMSYLVGLDEECNLTVVDATKNFLVHSWNKTH